MITATRPILQVPLLDEDETRAAIHNAIRPTLDALAEDYDEGRGYDITPTSAYVPLTGIDEAELPGHVSLDVDADDGEELTAYWTFDRIVTFYGLRQAIYVQDGYDHRN